VSFLSIIASQSQAVSNELPPPSDFASVLRNSLLRDYTHKATCQFCKQVTTQQTRRPLEAKDLPPILLINASVHNDDALGMWKDHKGGHYLKPFVGIDITTEPSQVGGIVSYSAEEQGSLVWYELRVSSSPKTNFMPDDYRAWSLKSVRRRLNRT
jgi:PAB-dependent poly(A)-specific ribonuclease subunit 2